MSQRRSKKQLSSLENANSLTDQELREALKTYGQSPGPITDSTRNLYRKKLASLIDEQIDEIGGAGGGGGDDDDNNEDDEIINNQSNNYSLNQSSRQQKSQSKPLPVKESLDALAENDDDDTSDEDYNAEEEEEEEESIDENEDEELTDESDQESEDDDKEEDELLDDQKLSTSTTELSTSIISGPEAVADRISKRILTILITFFITIISLYLYSTNNFKQFITVLPYKNLTKLLLVFIIFSPIGYMIYKTFSFYKKRRDEDSQRVCNLVNDALDLLQSPDNPKGMMPVLHIRDTLLTPAERKTKKMINLWNKAVKFMEEHESRVKVELVNIAGEDFRAWKWIGTRKL